jgi:lipoprotein-anchoring transpeptidase ErfK/SrfK
MRNSLRRRSYAPRNAPITGCETAWTQKRPATVDAVQAACGRGLLQRNDFADEQGPKITSTNPSPSGGRNRRWPAILALVAALITVVPIVIGVAITAAKPGPAAASGSSFKPVAPSPTASTPTPTPTSTHEKKPARQPGVLVALLQHATTMRTSPDGPTLAPLPLRTEFGSPQALWVVRRSGSWLGVVSPLAGNGKLGWIEQSSAKLGRVAWRINVSLNARRLTVSNNGKVVQRYTVAVGRPSAPTPTGRFAVTDRLLTGNPSGPYGCCILALSAKSPHAIQGWTGGNRIAIHSTPETSTIGQPVSHGCVRLTIAEGRWLMAHVPLGTPTIITA